MASRRLYLLHHKLAQRNDKLYRREVIPLDEYTEDELWCRYRFGRAGIEYIVDLLREEISPETQRSRSLSALMQVLITLRFLASGSFLQVIGDTFFAFDKATVSRVVRRATLALAAKVNEFIKFPQTREARNEVKQGLHKIANFPCAIGCVDGTHVRFVGPKQNEPDFVNRKGFHSINVQGICNHQGLFTNIVARWPGSMHYSQIFKTSSIGRQLDGNGLDNEVLLGDSGYACTPFLMTPYMNPQTRQQQQYNNIAHKKTRCLIERTFGFVKRRFHILHSEIRMSPDRVTTAFCVLHNIAIMRKEPEPQDDLPEANPRMHDMEINYHGQEIGSAVRNHITYTFFN